MKIINYNLELPKLERIEVKMGILKDNPIINAIWEMTKKNYPEFESPITPKDGIIKEEKNEDVEYCENSKNQNN